MSTAAECSTAPLSSPSSGYRRLVGATIRWQCNLHCKDSSLQVAALQEIVQLMRVLQGSAVWQRDALLRRRCGAAAQVLLLHLVTVRSSLSSLLTRDSLHDSSPVGSRDVMINCSAVHRWHPRRVAAARRGYETRSDGYRNLSSACSSWLLSALPSRQLTTSWRSSGCNKFGSRLRVDSASPCHGLLISSAACPCNILQRHFRTRKYRQNHVHAPVISSCPLPCHPMLQQPSCALCGKARCCLDDSRQLSSIR